MEEVTCEYYTKDEDGQVVRTYGPVEVDSLSTVIGYDLPVHKSVL